MTRSALPAAVARFLAEEVVSFERLGVLLLVRRNASRWWSAHGVALELLLPLPAAEAHLDYLSTRNLLDVRVAESVIYCYKPLTEELARLVDQVADAHYHHVEAIANVFASRPSANIRLFADAFRLRRGPRDG